MRSSGLSYAAGEDGPRADGAGSNAAPGDRNGLLDVAIDAFLVVWLIVASNAVIPLLMLGNSENLNADDLAFLRLLIVPFIIVTPFLLATRYRAAIDLLLHNLPLVVLLLWVWCSVAWSIDPALSARRALGLTMFTLLACYTVIRHDTDWLLRVLSWMIVVILVLSVLFILGLPELSRMPDERGLRGVFTHKNGMGELLVIAAIILPPAIRRRLVPAPVGWLGLGLAAALLLPVNSATATVVVLLIILTHVVLAVWRLPSRLAMAITALAISAVTLGAAILLANIDVIFDALGRDTTLTGRVGIWQFARTMIEQKPLLGYGYNAFWERPEFAQYAVDTFGWIVPNAHNGYLDTLLSIGVIGLVLMFVFFGSAVLRGLRRVTDADDIAASITLALIMGSLVRASLETNLLGQNSIIWVLTVIFTVAMTPGADSLRERS
ncbi:MAG: O-antigen ligase [Alphaproteobacteria bacterium]